MHKIDSSFCFSSLQVITPIKLRKMSQFTKMLLLVVAILGKYDFALDSFHKSKCSLLNWIVEKISENKL